MKLWIAGGVGEHGRNCFYVQEPGSCFLVDCGKMADAPSDPNPRLTPTQIGRIDAVFLTHSHADHTGALPWLRQQGFCKTVIAAGETLRQLPFAVPNAMALEQLCPGGSGRYRGLAIRWGRSGHCPGSVWYRFAAGGRSVFFSGDYTEHTQVYACDPVRGETADLAVLDCAYGKDETDYDTACDRLLCAAESLRAAHRLLLFPVPKYGRGLELLKLFSEWLHGAEYYADAHFLQTVAEQNAGGFWYRPAPIRVRPQRYCGQAQGIVFISDPQLRAAQSRQTAEWVCAQGGCAVMTGTPERGFLSAELLARGKMVLLRYPVHLNFAQYRQLAAENRFARTIPYHTPDFSAKREILL